MSTLDVPQNSSLGAKARRKSERHKSFKGARIVFQGGRASANCVVRNLSSGGAMLEGENLFAVPETFKLVFNDGSPARECVVKWKTVTALGVQFASHVRPPRERPL
jgi:hypothetical protein